MKPNRHPREQRQSQPRLSSPRSQQSPPRLVEVKPPESPESPESAAEPLKCVWSGYPHYDRDCRSRIPASVVVKAWQREMQLKGAIEGFFNFEWRHGVWLAYGLRGGGVRGIYCPTHRSERDSRGVLVEDRRAAHQPEAALH